MDLLQLKTELLVSEPFTRLPAQRPETGKPIEVSGLTGSLFSFAASGLFERSGQQLLLIVPDADRAERVWDDCSALEGEGHVVLNTYATHHAGAPLDMTAPVAQVEALRALERQQSCIVVSSLEAAVSPLIPPETLRFRTIELEAGDTTPFGALLEQLAALGFERRDFVEGYGDFAVRGGILDVFPFVGEHPIRIEFWGDTVESIREFDPLSQRSIRPLQRAALVADIHGTRDDDPEIPATLFDYLTDNALLLLDDPVLAEKELLELEREGITGLLSWEKFRERCLRHPVIMHSALPSGRPPVVDFAGKPQPPVNGSIRVLLRHFRELASAGYRTIVTCDTKEEGDRIRELVEEEWTSPSGSIAPADNEPPPAASPLPATDVPVTFETLNGALHSGFIYPPARLAVFTEHEIFGRLKRRGTSRRKAFRGITQKELQQLRRGDFVVHQDYGIGRFDGLHRIRVSGAEQEVMKLLYEGNDAVYVNLNFVNRVQKYSSQEGHVPKLSKLGTSQWDRLKSRVKKRIKDIARDLIQLYARRKHEEGFAFSEDTHWQREMEASFMFEDTPDQTRATFDVKNDMQQASPMDRLICGDVGFGKTEVAVRAAFKAVMDGKQVAVLVPTTILAQQHFSTFTDRLGRYAVRIGQLSRFRSSREQKQIAADLQEGRLDILIGTHRILSKDIRFRNLGLLIIDEEHRFGVTAKEKLRHLRATVDTLTLTATPIPRTLQFSLLGARDLSLINTPPRNRLPIVTEIVSFDLNLVREAILRELHRGGQVYFIHDRVHDIEVIRTLLGEKIPEARFHIAHGQMPGHELEKAMLGFLERKYDVLVCTKIIESGIDIPSVNTILINRADRFGMAELYQLRGRVGRSNVQAYAYLITPPLTALPRPTLRRLQAIQEFTELGSGFNLAMRDLEIRGAGNLLGAEQSGFILEMGFETYQRIVEEAVTELKEQEFSDVFRKEAPGAGLRPAEAVIETDIEAYIPEVYVESDGERLDLYRRLYRISRSEDLESLRAELKDRFGEYPEEVQNLLDIVGIRNLAVEAGFTKIQLSGHQLTFTLPPSEQQAFYADRDDRQAPFQALMERVSALRAFSPILRQEEKELKLRVLLSREIPNATRLASVRAFLLKILS